MKFKTILDCPDVMVQKDQCVELWYKYRWGMSERTRYVRLIPALQIHLCDLLKMRQNRLQCMYSVEQVGGEPPKLYEIVADAEAENDGMLRVIDEDGEDYLFEAKIFYSMVIPTDLAVALHERV